MNVGKCGHCGTVARNVLIENVEAKVGAFGAGGAYLAVSYLCTSCRAILRVQMDPVALKADIVADLVKALRGR